MLVVSGKEKVSRDALKCLSNDGKWIGGLEKTLRNVEDDREIQVGSFINSMVSYDGGILFGTADGRLGAICLDGSTDYVNLHADNICTLHEFNGKILTGSWDHFAILLVPTDQHRVEISHNGRFYIKKAFYHPATVWSVLILDDDIFLTGCADNKIRIYKNYSLVKELDYHSHVVRSFIVNEKIVYSVDNYGNMLKVHLDGQILRSRSLKEMCFGMTSFGEFILVCGENGSVFVMDRSLVVQYKLKLDCPTCWNIKAIGDNVLVAGSNGVLYRLGVDNDDLRYAEGDDVTCTCETDEDKKGESKSPELESNRLPTKDGIYNIGGSRYKIEKGKAYQDMSTHWELLGDTFDNSFTVELGENKYTLSFNNSENTHDIARRFLQENKLDPSYQQEIVDYINQNFRKDSMFKKYETIDVNGIGRFLPEHPILPILKDIADGQRYCIFKCCKKNIYQIEDVLNKMDENNLFVVLDVCKYLCFKKIQIDLTFLFRREFMNKKEALAFIHLMTNIVEDPPFNLERLHAKHKKLRDSGYLNLNDVSKYIHNYNIKNHKNIE